MRRSVTSVLAACAVILPSAAIATDLIPSFYSASSFVRSATPQCSSLGLSSGHTFNFSFYYPGKNNNGLILYYSASGILQICNVLSAVPAGGLSGFSSEASCTTHSVSGDLPSETIGLSFTGVQTDNAGVGSDGYSGVGTLTFVIPASAGSGGGCTAVLNTAVVRTGE